MLNFLCDGFKQLRKLFNLIPVDKCSNTEVQNSVSEFFLLNKGNTAEMETQPDLPFLLLNK